MTENDEKIQALDRRSWQIAAIGLLLVLLLITATIWTIVPKRHRFAASDLTRIPGLGGWKH